MKIAELQVTSEKGQAPGASALRALKVRRTVPGEPCVEVTNSKYQVPNTDVEGGAPSPPRHPDRMPLRSTRGQLSSGLHDGTFFTCKGGHGGPPSRRIAFVSTRRAMAALTLLALGTWTLVLRAKRANPARPEASPYPRSQSDKGQKHLGSQVGRTVPGEPRRLSAGSSAFKFIVGLAFFGALTAVCTNAADTKTPAAAATSPVTATGPTFESFRPIAEQNIFNPNRVGRSSRATRVDVPKPVEDSIRFVGTMVYEKGYFAFFDSPNAKFRSVLPQGGKVADFTVKRVTASGVDLIHGDRTVSLQVGQELTRPVGADWVVSATPARVEPTASSSTEASSSAAATPAAIPADASETLKRLMEQRQKQLKE